MIAMVFENDSKMFSKSLNGLYGKVQEPWVMIIDMLKMRQVISG